LDHVNFQPTREMSISPLSKTKSENSIIPVE
jgi:hypothetical protein